LAVAWRQKVDGAANRHPWTTQLVVWLKEQGFAK